MEHCGHFVNEVGQLTFNHCNNPTAALSQNIDSGTIRISFKAAKTIKLNFEEERDLVCAVYRGTDTD